MKPIATAVTMLMLMPNPHGREWVAIVPITKAFDVDLSSDLIVIEAPLKTVTGASYIFWCRGGSTKTLDELSEHQGINFVGPLMCALNDGNAMTESSLLAEEDVGPWHTRGMFHREELVGACGNYPEFGRHRTFRLRGFVLTLDAGAITLGEDGLPSRFTLTVSTKLDRTATKAQAERPGYLPPIPGHCGLVRKGVEPRQCRDWSKGGSYGPCPDE